MQNRNTFRRRYKADNPADCIQIGSIGPCTSGGDCSMKGKKVGTDLQVSFTYTYGCTNTFILTLKPGNAGNKPSQVTSSECSYSVTWDMLDKTATNGVSGPMAVWAWVVILLCFVGFPLYLGAGVFVKVKYQGEQFGAQAIPQLPFWLTLPGLVKDGSIFFIYKVQGKEPPEAIERGTRSEREEQIAAKDTAADNGGAAAKKRARRSTMPNLKDGDGASKRGDKKSSSKDKSSSSKLKSS